MAARGSLSMLTRGFSTSSSKAALVKTPIPVYGIEGRYSSALFSAAQKKKSLDVVEGDLVSYRFVAEGTNMIFLGLQKKLQGAMKSDARFAQFLLDPIIKNTLKVDGLNGAGKKLGFNELTTNLLIALAENNRCVSRFKGLSLIVNVYVRVSYLDAVVGSFGSLMAAHRGEVVCSVTTAKALDGAMKKDVEGAVKGFLTGKEKALITWSVDPKLIGGMVSALILLY